MYPMLKEGAFTWSFYDEYTETTHYYVENAAGDEFEINRRLYDSLCKADGTKPLNLPDKGKRILPMLKKHDLVRTSRFVQDEDSAFNQFILFPIGNTLQNGAFACKILNYVLPVASVLFFAIGMSLMTFGDIQTEYDYNLWLYFSLFVVSFALHEAGHLIACLAYGCKMNDTGILLLGIFPVGAYVAYEEKENASKTEKIQLALAGVEIDLLLVGVCLLVSAQCDLVASTMTAFAKMNLYMIGINLLPISGFDGEAALSALCGVNSINDTIKNRFANRRDTSRHRCSASEFHKLHRKT